MLETVRCAWEGFLLHRLVLGKDVNLKEDIFDVSPDLLRCQEEEEERTNPPSSPHGLSLGRFE